MNLAPVSDGSLCLFAVSARAAGNVGILKVTFEYRLPKQLRYSPPRAI